MLEKWPELIGDDSSFSSPSRMPCSARTVANTASRQHSISMVTEILLVRAHRCLYTRRWQRQTTQTKFWEGRLPTSTLDSRCQLFVRKRISLYMCFSVLKRINMK